MNVFNNFLIDYIGKKIHTTNEINKSSQYSLKNGNNTIKMSSHNWDIRSKLINSYKTKISMTVFRRQTCTL